MIVHALVKPNSRKGPLVAVADDGSLTVFVREPAIDGKANKAVIALLATHFDVSRRSVRLTGGAASRHKRFEIDH